MKGKTKLLIRDAFFSTILSALLVLILALLFFNIRFFNPLHKAFADFSFLDVFYSESFQENNKVNPDIILVNVGNENRLEIATMLEAVIREQPRTIGIDVIFKDRKENVFVDSMLASLLKHDNIVTSYNITEEAVDYNHPYFGNGTATGFVNYNFDDKTSVVREFVGKIQDEQGDQLSFASQIAKHYLSKKWKSLDYDNKLEQVQTIKFQGYYDTFQYLEPEDFVTYDRKSNLKDKIVIFGYLGVPTGSKDDIGDKFFTPLNVIVSGKSDADMFGTAIHANIVNMLIKNDFMVRISNFWMGLITFLCMFLSTIYYMRANKKYKISFRTRKRIFQFVISLLILTLSFWLFKLNVVLKPVLPILGIVLAGSYFKYYKHLTRYLKTKTSRKWKTYLK